MPCWCDCCRPPLQVARGQGVCARARDAHSAARATQQDVPHAAGGHAGPGRGRGWCAPAVGARRILDEPAAQALAAERVACAPGAALLALARRPACMRAALGTRCASAPPL
jgi:hypothetical protein